MITFAPRDILMLALLLLAACALGLAVGYLLQRVVRKGVPFDATRAAATFTGIWSFGMLFTLMSDLVTSAGQPFWLKIVLLALVLLMVASFATAQWRAFLKQYGGPTEPISKAGEGKV